MLLKIKWSLYNSERFIQQLPTLSPPGKYSVMQSYYRDEKWERGTSQKYCVYTTTNNTHWPWSNSIKVVYLQCYRSWKEKIEFLSGRIRKCDWKEYVEMGLWGCWRYGEAEGQEPVVVGVGCEREGVGRTRGQSFSWHRFLKAQCMGIIGWGCTSQHSSQDGVVGIETSGALGAGWWRDLNTNSLASA